MRTNLTRPLLMIVALILAACACNLSGSNSTPATPPVNAGLTPGKGINPVAGKCGDGTCDNFEQANLNLCPQDCAIPRSTLSTPTVAQTGGQYAFHINLKIDWSATCSDTVCDATYIPHLVLYFRGNLQTQADQSVSGIGTISFISLDPCQTLMPENSSCEIGIPTTGSFSISGRSTGKASGAKGETLFITLHEQSLPRLPLTHTIQSVQGSIDLPMENTFDSFLSNLVSQAGIFDHELELLAVEPSSDLSSTEMEQASHWFSSTYQLKTKEGNLQYNLSASGGLLFIRPDMPMP